MSSWHTRNYSKKREPKHNLSSSQSTVIHPETITPEKTFAHYEYIKNRKVCLIGHFGIGDFINILPIVNFFSQICSEVKVVCLEKAVNTIKQLYSQPNITFLVHNKLNTANKFPFNINSEWSKVYPLDEGLYKDELSNFTIIRYGLHKCYYELKNNLQYSDPKSYSHSYVPFDFYYQLNIPYNWFWYDSTLLPSSNIYLSRYLEDNNITDYVFVHNSSSDSVISSINLEWLSKFGISDNYLVINPNMNMYKETSKFYEIAEKFVNKPLFDYIDIISNAGFLFLTNSSFFCLSLHLNLKSKNNYVFKRHTQSINYLWENTYGFSKIEPLFREIDI
jgi:hypothetical protein